MKFASAAIFTLSSTSAFYALAEDVPIPASELHQQYIMELNEAQQEGRNIIVPLIVNGEEVDPPGKYPFMAYAYGCGASLVAPNVLLSAAHCTSINKVLIGAHSRLDENADGVEKITIAESKAHPSYGSNGIDYDYRVLRLSTESSYDPIEIDDGTLGFLQNGDELTVMGWGTVSEGGNSLATNLREVDVKVDAGCGTYSASQITDRMFCAGRTEGGTIYDSCQGDSGGPIIDKDSGVQVGIVSWGSGCARAGKPGVYSKISDQYDWINEMIEMWSGGSFPTQAPSNCQDYANWKDSYGDGCEWYEENDSEGCPNYGEYFDGGMGTPNEACCWCGGGTETTSPPQSSPATSAPSVSPTAGGDCSGISGQRQCNQAEGCSYHKKNKECVLAPSTEECSEFTKKRKCKRNACKFKNGSCVGRWE